MKREIYSSGGKWEDIIGYSRAVKVGNIIEVAGTTAADINGKPACESAYEQTLFILHKIEKALKEAGAEMKDVVRTRIFVKDISHNEEIGRAHGEFFSQIKPACTMMEVSNFIAPNLLVEIEVSAIISEL